MQYLKRIINKIIAPTFLLSVASVPFYANAFDKAEFSLAHIKESISVDGVMD